MSKRGRPGASGWVPRVPCLALGSGTHRWSRGRSGWVGAHRTRRASGRPSLTWRTTEHPTPPRGPRRVIGRASGASPGGDAGWSRGRWPVGDGAAYPVRWPRRPPLFLPGTPGSSPARLHLLPSPPRGVTQGKFPPHPPTPAPGGLPCDPNWPLRPVITAPVWFFFWWEEVPASPRRPNLRVFLST